MTSVAFGIFRLVPAGGLERHALRLAEALRKRDIAVTIFTTNGGETIPHDIGTMLLPPLGYANHTAMAAFSERFAAASAKHDAVVGFQKLSRLDVLFCADWCLLDRHLPPWKRLLPRYRVLERLERACFGADARTRIMTLSQPQLDAYVRAYGTPQHRTTVLPPTIDPRQHARQPRDPERAVATRTAHTIPTDARVWLWVGLQPHVKGLDRAVSALARHPDALLLVCGTGPDDREVTAQLARARSGGYADRIRVFGTVSDATLQDLYASADVLVHPARLDVTGTVILEAMANGLPVVTTANCGFSIHVAAAGAGEVVAMPFDELSFDRALARADATACAQWSERAWRYASNPELYSGIARAADLIENVARGETDEIWSA